MEVCTGVACDPGTGTPPTCDGYDVQAALECLGGTRTCDETVGLPVPPDACADVCAQ